MNLWSSTLCLLIKLFLMQEDKWINFGEINSSDNIVSLDFFSKNVVISSNDFKSIEKKLIKLALNLKKYEVVYLNKSEALEILKFDPFSTELINKSNLKKFKFLNLKEKNLLIWHEANILEKVSLLKFFSLLSISGVYWQGKETNNQLTRISFVAFPEQNELDKFLKELEESKERDHRRIGKNLELFTFNSLTGAGMPIWLPAGTILRNLIGDYVHDCQIKYGFNFVCTPVMGNLDLYKLSGHYSHYGEDMFPPMKLNNEMMILRPMTCPHHCLVYLSKPRSYRDLPIRLSEDSILHRYESSGALTGLERVRMMTLLDNHIFCLPDQIENEIINAYKIINEVMNTFNIKFDHVDLSLHDPKNKSKFIDDEKMWETSESQLELALQKLNIKYSKQIGDAAFYGPKIDFQCRTALNKIITCSTIQLDFSLPKKFNTVYINSNNQESNCVIVHLGIIGTYERFIATLLEQTSGVLPLWLAPLQVQIIPVNNQIHNSACQKLFKFLTDNKIRCEVDNREERLAKKIRDAQTRKVPLQVVIGDREVENLDQINYRQYGSETVITISTNDFVKMIHDAGIKHKN
ncbi:threonine--tRNA ligase [Mycoplasmoides alvi]|uniref:threonine--tRNA ligase n=1 Tax=Mycoplasmoides alvi TaxID=78580 RepID=UPI00051B90A3|nr:threonine--tRNA ligase [Mycoplasmoides alvi]